MKYEIEIRIWEAGMGWSSEDLNIAEQQILNYVKIVIFD